MNITNLKYLILSAWLSFWYAKNTYAQVTIPNPIAPLDSFAGVAKAIADMLAALGLPLAVIFFIWSGFLFVTSRGNEQQLVRAKKAFFWTAVGTILLIGAWALATAVANFVRTIP